MVTNIMDVLGLDYGDADQLDKIWAKFYHEDLTAKLDRQERQIADLTSRIEHFERNFESPLT